MRKKVRIKVQIAFALVVLLIGIKFFMFVNYITSADSALAVNRPPGVEAFLPISALVSLRAWLGLGIFDTIHPAALVIFLTAIFISLFLKRAFCSWICPIGTLSEGLSLLGQKMFKTNYTLPKWLDYPFRSVKYILLTFFVVFIFFGMSPMEAYSFLQTPYNMIADVKMLTFFQNITAVGMTVIAVLVVLSLLIKQFWCRYLCPYGALLGLFSVISPWKITRDSSSCISCGQCRKACPNQLKVDEALRVSSPECTGCLSCVEVCPVKGTLSFKLPRKLHRFPSPFALGVTLIAVWFISVSIAKITGHWETSIPLEMYKTLIP
ncbi:4Fe-4S binding protein [Desulfitobacterium metallireducens]|nr:4Fe-4S binding protein [Desulfitobacterium metallireducens]